MSQEFVGQSELQEYAERNGLDYVWEYTRTFAKRQRLLAPEQYKIVELRTSRGLSRGDAVLEDYPAGGAAGGCVGARSDGSSRISSKTSTQ